MSEGEKECPAEYAARLLREATEAVKRNHVVLKGLRTAKKNAQDAGRKKQEKGISDLMDASLDVHSHLIKVEKERHEVAQLLLHMIGKQEGGAA